jgi:hypothetical protein
MKIYFDSCAIQRPLDKADHVRVTLEIDALIGLFAEVDYFCTCDDRLLRRAKSISDLHTPIVSPLELVEALNL